MAIVNANMDIMAMGTNAKKVRRMLIYLSYAFVSIVQYIENIYCYLMTNAVFLPY